MHWLGRTKYDSESMFKHPTVGIWLGGNGGVKRLRVLP